MNQKKFEEFTVKLIEEQSENEEKYQGVQLTPATNSVKREKYWLRLWTQEKKKNKRSTLEWNKRVIESVLQYQYQLRKQEIEQRKRKRKRLQQYWDDNWYQT